MWENIRHLWNHQPEDIEDLFSHWKPHLSTPSQAFFIVHLRTYWNTCCTAIFSRRPWKSLWKPPDPSSLLSLHRFTHLFLNGLLIQPEFDRTMFIYQRVRTINHKMVYLMVTMKKTARSSYHISFAGLDWGTIYTKPWFLQSHNGVPISCNKSLNPSSAMW